LQTALLLLGALYPATPYAATIWKEGEAATTRHNTPHSWYDKVKIDVLSGGRWISHFDKNREGEVGYRIEIAASGRYTFWLRANPVKSKLDYRLDKGSWTPIDFSRDLRGQLNIAADNKPDLRFIAWVKVGDVSLSAGRHTLDFRFYSGPQNHGAIDCFCLADDGFVPSGKKRPSQGTMAARRPDQWFPVVFDDDPLSPQSVTDISRLVPAPAGQFGFLRRKKDTLCFEQSASPTRFWGVGATFWRFDPDKADHTAAWLRKHGVNMVRHHPMTSAVGLLSPSGTFDRGKLDRFDRWFAALKKHGIYSTWSVIYPHHAPILRRADGCDSALFKELDRADARRDGNREAIVVNDFLNLDRKLQDIVLRYFEKLLEHRNPYTGLTYRDEPALAVLEFQNESNIFFHTLNGLRGGKHPLLAARMRKGFFAFVRQKYGNRSAVARAWGNRWDRNDRWEAGELGLMGAYHWGKDGPLYEYQGQRRRAGDYIGFLTGLQKEYFTRREKEIRALGFKGITVTTAWKAGGAAASLGSLYCDDTADMIDRHNYVGGGAGRHRIIEGNAWNKTHLDSPGRYLLNLAFFQVRDKPFAVSEWSMTAPAPYKAEAAPLYAFYGMGLQGWDSVCHFSCGNTRMGDGWPRLSKYASDTPHYMGQFPALAFAVHNGHIREGVVVAGRCVTRDDLFAGRDVLGQALSGGGHDDKRLSGQPATPPEAVAIGRITVGFNGDRPVAKDLQSFWDAQNKTLTSTTRELVWHYGDRFIEVRSPKTQGVVGFASGRLLILPGVSVKTTTPFVSLLFTPLDNRVLTESRHVLITAMARDRQTGARYNPDESKLLLVGGPPLLMEPVQADIRFSNRRPEIVRPLDVYGVPKEEALPVTDGGTFRIDGRYAAYYYEVRLPAR
jgi:hypothetical protein